MKFKKMKSEFVSYHCKERIGFITIQRAEKKNALNEQVVNNLSLIFSHAEKDKNCKIIILQSEGDVFCAGADLGYLKQLQKNSFEENLSDSKNLMSLFHQIYSCPKIVICKIQGHAIAGGCGLATVCDLSISSEEAKFGYTEVKIGFIPAIVSVFLLQKIGEAKTKELLLSGNIISAKEAQGYGMINKVVAKNNLEESVIKLAANMCDTTSAESIALTKKLIHDISNKDMLTGLDLAANANAKSRESEGFNKGVSAFLNKEKLSW